MNNEIKINIKIFYYIIKNENDKVKDRTPDSCENGVLLHYTPPEQSDGAGGLKSSKENTEGLNINIHRC